MIGTDSKVSAGRLILVPAIITLAITTLRLIGELQGWSPFLFNKAPGGGFALVGISWLPVVFGPYFAWKVAVAGAGPSGMGKAFGMAGLAVARATCLGLPSVLYFGFSKQMVHVAFLGGVIQSDRRLWRASVGAPSATLAGLRVRRSYPGRRGDVYRHERQRRHGLGDALRCRPRLHGHVPRSEVLGAIRDSADGL